MTMKRWIIFIVVFTLTFTAVGCQDRSLDSSSTRLRSKNKEIDERSVHSSEDDSPDSNCTEMDPHPIAKSIEENFDISYGEIIGWYCDGYAFSDILLALETEKLVDVSIPDLLSRVETQSWEDIWLDLGVTTE
jgi:hypothetical protein